MPTAAIGAANISRQNGRRDAVPTSPRATRAADVHSRRRRPRRRRTSVRRIASARTTARWGRRTTCRIHSADAGRSRSVTPRTAGGRAETRFAESRPPIASVSRGAASTRSAMPVHTAGGPGNASQARSRKPSSVGGSRVRRRLSMIFQREISDSRFGPLPPSARGTRRRSQGSSCQSPRAQRWRRRQ